MKVKTLFARIGFSIDLFDAKTALVAVNDRVAVCFIARWVAWNARRVYDSTEMQ
jgi:hypothetical protein